MRLISESKGVIKARSRSERDVKGFIKTGLAAEHHRVGKMLNDVLEAALSLDWSSQQLRRTKTTLPLLAINLSNVPTPERLRLFDLNTTEDATLDLTPVSANLNDIGDEFWVSFDTLDREDLYKKTLQLLTDKGEAMSISDIARELAPHHDLEAVAFWLGVARESADSKLPATDECFEIEGSDGRRLKYTIPGLKLDVAGLKAINWENV